MHLHWFTTTGIYHIIMIWCISTIMAKLRYHSTAMVFKLIGQLCNLKITACVIRIPLIFYSFMTINMRRIKHLLQNHLGQSLLNIICMWYWHLLWVPTKMLPSGWSQGGSHWRVNYVFFLKHFLQNYLLHLQQIS